MKPITCILLLLSILSASCNSTSEQRANNDSLSTVPIDKKDLINKLFGFVETNDKNFCNPDSIYGGDCNGGDIYFTEKGNVVYTFYCYGSDTNSFSIGKYQINGNSIECTFDRDYSFFNGQTDADTLRPYNPNDGKLKTTKAFTLLLNRINCKPYEYSFLDKGNGTGKFVLSRQAPDQERYFFDDFNKINVLMNL